jgi:hypothetical protein
MEHIKSDTWDRIDEFEAFRELEPIETADDAPEAKVVAEAMHEALEWLRVEHLPFRHANQDEIRELDELRQRILEAVSKDGELDEYYEEAWNGVIASSSNLTEGGRQGYRLVAAMQIQLMERAFYLLRLSFFASARENAGWMDLFRRWGSSPRFNRVYDSLSRTVSPAFADFYRDFVRDRMIRREPAVPGRLWEYSGSPFTKAAIPHPWLGQEPGLYMDSGLVEAHVQPGAGGITDSKGDEGADKSYETPSDSVDQ